MIAAHARQASVLQVTLTLPCMSWRYFATLSAERCDRRDRQPMHKGRSVMSVAIRAAYAGISLASSHRSQFNGASASIALTPRTTKAWFSAHGECGCPRIYEADLEVESQAAIAICERVLANQKLSQLPDGVSSEPYVRSHIGRLCRFRIAALESRGVGRRWTRYVFMKRFRGSLTMSAERGNGKAANRGGPRP